MDEDDKTIEHREAELTPEARRRFSRRTWIYLGLMVAVFWAGALYFEGWSWLDWRQVCLGGITVFWIMGALTDLTGVFKD